MNNTFEIPRDIEEQVRTNGTDLNGKAREAFLVELYREHKISHRHLGEALDLEPYETDGLLKRYHVGLGITAEELRDEASALRTVSPK
jgi:predicted HTH domain antitoxin